MNHYEIKKKAFKWRCLKLQNHLLSLQILVFCEDEDFMLFRRSILAFTLSH